MTEFLQYPFRTLSGGGIAGLVFLVARSADAPRLQRRFFREWSDIDDLTGPYLGVITPVPEDTEDTEVTVRLAPRLTDSYPHPWADEYLYVKGIRCLNNKDRLRDAARFSPSAVRMAPDLPGSVAAHQRALTHAVYEMQEFFGIPDQLGPCVVVSSLEEREIFVVAVDDTHSVYQLLRRITSRIEPFTPRIRKKEYELTAAQEARRQMQNPKCKWRRIVRILADLNGDHSSEHQVHGWAEAKDAVALRIGRVKAELDDLGRELRLGAAVVAAATEELGLERTSADMLRSGRGTDWPISVLAGPKPHRPTVRLGRA